MSGVDLSKTDVSNHTNLIVIMLFLYIWIFLSIVLESFPISSSGHLLLFTKWFGDAVSIPYGLDHFMHCAPALVLPLYFLKDWLYLMRFDDWRAFSYRLFLGFIVEIITVAFYGFFAIVSPDFFSIYLGFFITGCALYSLRFISFGNAEWNIYNSIALGIAQGFALLPGISRFGITYAVARWSGISNVTAFALSFLIEWPISIAGFAKGAYLLQKQQLLIELLNPMMLLIMFIAMILMYVGLCLMHYMVKKNQLWIFSIYLFVISSIALWGECERK